MTDKKLIKIGKITAPHGLGGQVKLVSYSEIGQDIEKYQPLYDAQGEKVFAITKLRIGAKNSFIASFEGVNNREQAEQLANQELYITKKQLVDNMEEMDEDEFLAIDLVGLEVMVEGQGEYGIVKNIHNFGASDLLEITLSGGDKTEFFQFSKDNFPDVNMNERRITFCPPEILMTKPMSDDDMVRIK